MALLISSSIISLVMIFFCSVSTEVKSKPMARPHGVESTFQTILYCLDCYIVYGSMGPSLYILFFVVFFFSKLAIFWILVHSHSNFV